MDVFAPQRAGPELEASLEGRLRVIEDALVRVSALLGSAAAAGLLGGASDTTGGGIAALMPEGGGVVLLAGDVTGPSSGNTVEKIQNIPVEDPDATADPSKALYFTGTEYVHLGPTWEPQTKTASYTLTADETIVLANAASAAITVTLPTAVGIGGRIFSVKKTDTSSNLVTLATTSSQTIDGETTAEISSAYTSLAVVSDGANWHILMAYEPGATTEDVTEMQSQQKLTNELLLLILTELRSAGRGGTQVPPHKP